MEKESKKESRGSGKKRRFIWMKLLRGYLMIAGGAVTVYGLIQLIVWLLVEINGLYS